MKKNRVFNDIVEIMTGKTYHYLTVKEIKRVKFKDKNNYGWTCICDCRCGGVKVTGHRLLERRAVRYCASCGKNVMKNTVWANNR